MHYKLLIAIGSIISTSIVTTIAVASTTPTNTNTACFMQTPTGKTIDLTNLCGQSSAPLLPSLIDPNMPVEIVMPSSDKPSAMWQSIPDAATAPIAGGTYQQPANIPVESIPGSTASPAK